MTTRERPILFAGPMVRAILDGVKTQTRRVVKRQPPADAHSACLCEADGTWVVWCGGMGTEGRSCDEWHTLTQRAYPRGADGLRCPYGVPGDRLWVREAFMPCVCGRCLAAWPKQGPHGVTYRASPQWRMDYAVRPSIHMPRWASRLTLEITGVRVERLQEIGDEDAQAEGFTKQGVWWDVGKDWQGDGIGYPDARDGFGELWDSLNAKRGYGWDVNPWVWVVSFQRAGADSAWRVAP